MENISADIPQSSAETRRPQVTPSSVRVLVVDDEESMRHMLTTVLGREGFACASAANAIEALDLLGTESFGVVICDVRMPGMDGITFLRALKERDLAPTVVVMSAYGSLDLARQAIQEGAYFYLNKPFTADEVILVATMAQEHARLREENKALRRAVDGVKSPMPGIIGRSPVMLSVFETIRRVAGFNSTVLVTGESGTGKELVAKALHTLSPRKNKPFIAVNCGAIPETLIESELFGYVKGAFTGATRTKKGLVEEANTGTLFLDEIGELPPAMQVKFLRFLQESEIRRVGENKAVRVDVRIVAATARRLAEEAKAGTFREDLYYRLNVLPIELPPLRDRREDLPLLIEHFIKDQATKAGRVVRGVTEAAMAKLLSDPWVGNVRELQNTIERIVVLARGEIIDVNDLPDKLRLRTPTPSAKPAFNTKPTSTDVIPADAPSEDLSIKKASRNLERDLIASALERTGGNRTQAARLLEISHRALLYKIREYGLE